MPLEPELFNFTVEIYVPNVTLVNIKSHHRAYLVLSYVFPLHRDDIHVRHADSESNLILEEVVH